MLVLSRKPGESISIPGVGTIKVLEFRGGRIRLGFELAEDVLAIRSELLDNLGQFRGVDIPADPNDPVFSVA